MAEERPTSVILTPSAATPPQPREAAQVGEPRRVNNLTLVDGKTFLATTVAGDIAPAGSTDVGLFHLDTRFLSYLELRVNDHRTVVLSSSEQRNLSAQIELTTSQMVVRESLDLPDKTLHIRREQVLAGCFYDRLTVENFNLHPVSLQLEWLADADFVDVFQVRGMLRKEAGTHFDPVVQADTLTFSYLGRDGLFRQTVLRFAPAPARLTASGAHYSLHLKPREKVDLLLRVEPLAEGEPGARAGSAPAGPLLDYQAHRSQRLHGYQDWTTHSTSFESSNGAFDTCLATALSDFFALRIPRPPAGNVIAAGIPWFATVFGRDSLIAAYQSLLLHSRLAVDTLRYLALHQGRELNPARDEQPGRILHEEREGEMTRCGEMPFNPYYGSIDSTPLFLIVLSEAFNWTGDRALLEELLPAARRALQWMDEYGDRDHDGLIEYERMADRGLANQGWKDSWDATLNRQGQLLQPPIALCEVQGYAFDARYRMARLFHLVGDHVFADRLRQQAATAAKRFEETFWMPSEHFYAMALDGRKQQQQVIASNPGHLLWSRMLSPERARTVADRLMREDMFSGWGIRTLSADESTFNPLSYHRGSVWPHDNSLIGQGLAFYGQHAALQRLFTALFEAATHFRNQRLPELFVGVQRCGSDEPVHYPVSCSPQAWASGALLLLLNASLGLRPNAARHELRIVNPVLPEWLDWLRVHQLHIGHSQVSLEFSRRQKRTFCNVLDVQGDALTVSVDFTRQS
ncbi:MAG: amylo-alpha-1,6-glucosidase [Terriglobales bacterium]